MLEGYTTFKIPINNHSVPLLPIKADIPFQTFVMHFEFQFENCEARISIDQIGLHFHIYLYTYLTCEAQSF